MPKPTSPYRNAVLNALDEDSLTRLHLHRVQFELRHEMEFPGKRIEHLYFVESGMASMTTTFADGAQVEVGMFGYESIVGLSGLMGTKRSLNRIYTQIAGHGYSCRIGVARREFALGGTFQMLALQYVQAQLVEAVQSAGCNMKHTVDQRLARWLLLCADRAQSDRFIMSHIFLADMLGSSRPTVSLAARLLKDAKLIEYTRGTITLLNVPGLEARACECYHIIKDHLDNYREFNAIKLA
jgi:CRP-like cAMP-binding protein